MGSYAKNDCLIHLGNIFDSVLCRNGLMNISGGALHLIAPHSAGIFQKLKGIKRKTKMKIKKEANFKAIEAQGNSCLLEIMWHRSCRRSCAAKAAAVSWEQTAYSIIKETDSSSMCLASKAEPIT